MKMILLLIIAPLMSISQLKIEWNKELDILGSDYEQITGLILRNDENHMCAVSNVSGTTVYHYSYNSQPIASYTLPPFVSWFQSEQGKFYSKDECWLRERNWTTGEIIWEKCLEVEVNYPATSPVSMIYYDKCFVAHANYFLGYNMNGSVLFKKETGASVQPLNIKAGGKFIYLSSWHYSTSEFQLSQYDTLGNKKWSIVTSDIRNILADNIGNCYIACLSGDQASISKLDTEGKEVWTSVVPSQLIKGSYKLGDSIFVCGNLSKNGATSNWQRCAYSILSASTGKILSQQIIDLYEDPNEREFFTQIASDGKNIYIAGSHSDYSPQCFLIKLSKEGPTRLTEESKNTSFTIFPNPSGSKFTISCVDQGVSTLKVTVRNITGQVVHKETLSCNDKKSYELNLEKQPSGNYTVEIENGNKKVVKKVVVE